MNDELRTRCLETGLFDYENGVALSEKLKTARAGLVEATKALEPAGLETTEEEDERLAAALVLLGELEGRNRRNLDRHRERLTNSATQPAPGRS